MRTNPRALANQASNNPEQVIPKLENKIKSNGESKYTAAKTLRLVAEESPEDVRSVVDALGICLKCKKDSVRLEAADALVAVAEEFPEDVRPMINPLQDCLVDENEDIREAAIQSLALVAEEYPEAVRPAVNALQDRLYHEYWRVRREAVEMLTTIAERSLTAVLPAIDALIECLDDGAVEVRASAAENIAILAIKYPNQVIHRVEKYLAFDKQSVCHKATPVRVFATIAEESPEAILSTVDNLQDCLMDEHVSVRRHATNALVLVAEESPEAVQPAIDTLRVRLEEENESDDVRREAIRALALVAQDHPEAVQPVSNVFHDELIDKHEEVREPVTKALAAVAKKYPEDVRPMVNFLHARLNDEGELLSVRDNAAEALAAVAEEYPENVQSLEELKPYADSAIDITEQRIDEVYESVPAEQHDKLKFGPDLLASETNTFEIGQYAVSINNARQAQKAISVEERIARACLIRDRTVETLSILDANHKEVEKAIRTARDALANQDYETAQQEADRAVEHAESARAELVDRELEHISNFEEIIASVSHEELNVTRITTLVGEIRTAAADNDHLSALESTAKAWEIALTALPAWIEKLSREASKATETGEYWCTKAQLDAYEELGATLDPIVKEIKAGKTRERVDLRQDVLEVFDECNLQAVRTRLEMAESILADGTVERAETIFEQSAEELSTLELETVPPEEADRLHQRVNDGLNECTIAKLEQRAATAEAKVEQGEYAAAEDAFEDLLTDIRSLEFDRSEVESLRNRIETGFDDITIARLEQRAADAETHFEQGAYVEAADAFDTLLADLDALEIDRPELDSLRERARDGLDDTIGAFERQVSNAETKIDQGEYSQAQETLEILSGQLEALDLGTDYSEEVESLRRWITDNKDIVQFEQRVADAEVHLNRDEYVEAEDAFEELLEDLDSLDVERPGKIAELRQRIQADHLQAQLEQGRKKRDQAVQQFKQREFYEAREAFEELREAIEPVLSLATKYGLIEQKKELLRLDEQCRVNASEARQAIHGIGVDTPELTSIDEVEVEERSGAEPTSQPTARDEQRTRERAWEQSASPSRMRIEDDLKDELPDHEILERVGQGGNATVWKVRLTNTNEIAALKVPQLEGAFENPAVEGRDTIPNPVVRDFMNEAQTWERLDGHPNIINVTEYGSSPYPWILLEFMEGGNMTDRSTPAPIEVIDWMLNVCNATHHAHNHGVVHTDLKPENIMFTQEDDEEMVKVGDWGLAKVMLEHSKSVDGMTPTYAAPEQVEPDTYGETGPATDIYQIGVIAYELLTGRPPFDYDSLPATMNAIVSKEPTLPSEHDSDLPPELNEILGEALAKSKADRYESVLYLRDALRGVRDSLAEALS